jgi:dinuclear metal center YbgI/SA1388 family protein
MIEEAEEGTLFVVHHPLIFKGLQALDFSKYPANLIERLIQKNQSLIAAHTNFDQTHLNRYVFETVLGFVSSHRDPSHPYICQAEKEWQLPELVAHLKARLRLASVRVVSARETIRSVAMTTGSGASLMDEVRAECFLTGDLKYHDAIKAYHQGLTLIDIGHFESERYFGEVMKEVLKTLPVLVIITPPKNPFTTYGHLP